MTSMLPPKAGSRFRHRYLCRKAQAAPLPAITMAHGYAGTQYRGLEPLAEAFAASGFVVLLHDHRNFGESGGEPRHDINPLQQISDWRLRIHPTKHIRTSDGGS
jgi:uncharacterized protein